MRIKFTSFIFFITLLQVSAAGLAQKVTYKQQNVTLKQLFGEINKQTGYNVFWSPKLIRGSEKINADFKNTPIEEVLEKSLNGLPLTFVIEDKTVVIKEKEHSMLNGIFSLLSNIDVRGKVLDENGRPLVGATVAVKGGKVATTDKEGNFQLTNIDEKAVLYVSYIGYAGKEVPASGSFLLIKLNLSDSKLDEVQVMAYGTTSRRLGTGNISTVSGEVINNTPVSNPMLALQNRVAGMIVTQNSGVPGSGVSIQIRGRTRVDTQYGASESPLFVIDGVPMAAGNDNLNLLGSAISASGTSGLSPFSTISAGDIESIDVLKDADATAIYGSRGASGVILITTRKGKPGATSITARFGSGFSKAPIPGMLNTQEYIAMRKEAFKNDNKAMTAANAYDLLLWDTTRTTNLAKELLGGSATYTNGEASVSGGSELVQYVVRSTYTRETNVYPKPMPNTKVSVYGNLTGKAFANKLTFNFVGSYTDNKNQTTGTDLSMKLTLPPYFKLYNDDGSLAWNEGGLKVSGMENPLAYLEEQYTAKTGNLTGNLLLSYAVTPNLTVKTSFGYNTIRTDELRNSPKTAKNPMEANISNTSDFGHGVFESAIFEPQVEYKKSINKNNFNILAGGTLQSQTRDGYSFTLRDYASDALLGTMFGISSGSFVNPKSIATEYKYAALFGRATYNYDNTYILNISGRRDGSSRFGPNFRYSNFGAVGAAWLFSNLTLLKDNKILSFGKLRASYGITGNDQIGDYQYMALYSSNAFGPTYKDSLAIRPESFFKPDLHWEKNKKLEFAADLGFFKDKIVMGLAWYRNNSNDPLVQYPLPNATGFSTVTANLNDVVVQNRGWEFTLSTQNIQKKNFSWNSSFNLTLPNNQLLKYPGLAQSSYANKYIIGRSLDVVYIAHSLGVDPTNGLYNVQDVNNTGKFEITNSGDLLPQFDTEPSFYGGLQNDFKYKNFGLGFFFNFNKQYLRNWMMALNSDSPLGNAYNVPRNALNRWQYEGQETTVQKYTTNAQPSNSLVGQRAAYFSDAIYNNVFYMRLRTVTLNYSLSQKIANSIGVKSAGIYFQGQNLFTFSPFSNTDPETVFITRLAPLRTYLMGLQISL